MSSTKLTSNVQRWCLIALLLAVALAVLCAHAQEESSEIDSLDSYPTTSESYPSSADSVIDWLSSSSVADSSSANVENTTEAPTTTSLCQVIGCQICVANDTDRCAACANGYTIQDDASCKRAGDGGFAAPSAGVMAVLVSAAVALCSVAAGF